MMWRAEAVRQLHHSSWVCLHAFQPRWISQCCIVTFDIAFTWPCYRGNGSDTFLIDILKVVMTILGLAISGLVGADITVTFKVLLWIFLSTLVLKLVIFIASAKHELSVGRGRKTECNMVGNLLEEEDFGNGIKLCSVGCSSPVFFFLVNLHTVELNCKSHHILRKRSQMSPYLENEFLLVARTRQESQKSPLYFLISD